MSMNQITALRRRRSARATTLGVDRHFFSLDDRALIRQIGSTHAPKFQYDDVRPILSNVEDILRLAKPLNTVAKTTLAVETEIHKDKLDDNVLRDKLAHPINRISRELEIICQCAVRGKSHEVTMDLLTLLLSYPWDAKVAITFAAVAINYGEFWLLEQYHTEDPLAKNIATLKDLPYLMADADVKKFDNVLDLLHSSLKLTHCIVEVIRRPKLDINPPQPPDVTPPMVHIPIAVYCIIRSLVVCSFTIPSLVRTRIEYIVSTVEFWEIMSLTRKVQEIREHLQNSLELLSSELSHLDDNIKVLWAMIRWKQDERPLYHGTRKTKERLEVLRFKYVLLLITDLDVHEELNVLHLIYNEQAMRHEYEVLWLPIGDPTSPTFQDSVFYDLRNNSMPWYSVDH